MKSCGMVNLVYFAFSVYLSSSAPFSDGQDLGDTPSHPGTSHISELSLVFPWLG